MGPIHWGDERRPNSKYGRCRKSEEKRKKKFIYFLVGKDREQTPAPQREGREGLTEFDLPCLPGSRTAHGIWEINRRKNLHSSSPFATTKGGRERERKEPS